MVHHGQAGDRNPAGRKISPAPDWRAIFSVHHELSPPGYDEVFLDCLENPPAPTPSQLKREETQAKKKKKKLGRGQQA